MITAYETRLALRRKYTKPKIYNGACEICGGTFETTYPHQKYHKECSRKRAAEKALANKNRTVL